MSDLTQEQTDALVQQVAKSEARRIEDILESPEAQANRGYAAQLALTTNLKTCDVLGLLEMSIAKHLDAADMNPLDTAMQMLGNPDITPDGGADTYAEMSTQQLVANMLALSGQLGEDHA